MGERADMKLKLDSLVIQQGRLADNKSNKLKSNDIMEMIRHGAQKVFAGKDSTISDDDINRILEQAEKYTDEQNEKLSKLSEENLQKFSTDYEAPSQNNKDNEGNKDKKGFSVYSFEGENWKEKQKENNHEKALANWISLPKRERTKKAYNIDNYFKKALSVTTSKKEAKAPRYRKAPQINSYQFFPAELSDILERQMFYYYKQNSQFRKIEEFREFDDPETELKRVNNEIKNSQPLSEEETAKRDALLQQGFLTFEN